MDEMALVIITARGGSKGIPGKNLASLAGVPMIDYSCSAALEAAIPGSRIVLNTDSEEIAARVRARYPSIEIPFMRPAELASDGTSSAAVVNHQLEWHRQHESYEPDAIILLQPTSPLRLAEHIRDGYRDFTASSASSMIGVSPAQEHPAELVIPEGAKFRYVMETPSGAARQSFPEVLFINGALYIVKREFFLKTGKFFDEHARLYRMDRVHSIDINDPTDLKFAEALITSDPSLSARSRKL